MKANPPRIIRFNDEGISVHQTQDDGPTWFIRWSEIIEIATWKE